MIKHATPKSLYRSRCRSCAAGRRPCAAGQAAARADVPVLHHCPRLGERKMMPETASFRAACGRYLHLWHLDDRCLQVRPHRLGDMAACASAAPAQGGSAGMDQAHSADGPHVIGFDGKSHVIWRNGEVVFEGSRIIFVGRGFEGHVDERIDYGNAIIGAGVHRPRCAGRPRLRRC